MIRSTNPWVFRGRIHYTNCISALYPAARGHFRWKCNGKVRLFAGNASFLDAFPAKRLLRVKSIFCRMDPVLLHDSSKLSS